jgi:hypothetical protein
MDVSVKSKADKASYKAKQAGKVEIFLAPKWGETVASATVTLSGPKAIEFPKPKETVGKFAKKKTLQLALKVAEDAKPGLYAVKLNLRYKIGEEEQELLLEIPVLVE